MILETRTGPEGRDALAAHDADVTIIGAGPLGIITALALADRGCRVLILESGAAGSGPAQALAAGELLTPETHHAPDITVARRLGGTGNLWGGRCLPFDPIDFQARPWLGLGAWPIEVDDLAPYLAPALKLLGAGRPVLSAPVPGVVPQSPDFTIDSLERWSDQPKIHLLHKTRLAEDPSILVALGVTVTGWNRDQQGRISDLEIRVGAPEDQTDPATLPTREVILAAGGNASLALMLNVQDRAASRGETLFGGADGPLGRFYMGHVNGQIADIVFENEILHDAMDFFVEGGDEGSYARRRFAPSADIQEQAGIANVTFWPVVPEIAEFAHRSGALSAVFLALSFPGLGRRIIAEPIRLKHIGRPPYRRLPHIRNVLTDLLGTAAFVPRFLWNRHMAKHRVPGFFLHNKGRRYGLEFHAEHLPDPDSRITLSDRRDAFGQRLPKIDFRFSEADVANVLAAHDAFEHWLTEAGYGHLIYRFAPEARAGGVLSEAQHGNHQIGTIRMGQGPEDGIVDGWGTTFDSANLHLVSTAILPTSSQANPTLTAAQLGLRLVDHLLAGSVPAVARAAPAPTEHEEGLGGMQASILPGLDRPVSRLGFGCASLGSRVSETAGQAALSRAFEAGVNWYDLAPAYGAGRAEEIFADFLRGVDRDRVQICTKVGLLPPTQSAVKRVLMPLARQAVGVIGPLRAVIRGSGATANRRVVLTPELLRSSLERSLTRLGTDHVEAYGLHNVQPEDLASDEILRVLEDLVTSGKTRMITTAGGMDAARAALDLGNSPIGGLQFAHPETESDIFTAARSAGLATISHSVFGLGDGLAHLAARLRAEPRLQQTLAGAGIDGTPKAMAARALLMRALGQNRDGVVLVSMFSEHSLAANLEALDGAINRTPAPDLWAEITG